MKKLNELRKEAKTSRDSIIRVWISVLIVFVILLKVVSGVELLTNSAIIKNNTDMVYADINMYPVEYITDYNVAVLSDGTEVYYIEENNIRTQADSGLYVNRETGQIAVEITWKDAVMASLRFLLIDLCLFVVLILLSVNTFNKSSFVGKIVLFVYQYLSTIMSFAVTDIAFSNFGIECWYISAYYLIKCVLLGYFIGWCRRRSGV